MRILLFGLCLITPPAIQGQKGGGAGDPALPGRWAAGISLGSWSFGDASTGTDGEGNRLRFRPYRPTMWGLAAHIGRSGFRAGLAARVGDPGLAAQGEEVSESGLVSGPLLVYDGAYRLVALTVMVSERIARVHGGPSIRGVLGFGLERWTPAGESGKTIGAALAGVGLEIQLSRRWVGTVGGEVGYTPASPFQGRHLPSGFRTTGTWRRALTAALERRF